MIESYGVNIFEIKHLPSAQILIILNLPDIGEIVCG